VSGPGSIRVTTRVAVDPQTAFEVFTGEVDAWWCRGPRFRWAPGRGGRLRFEPGVGGRLVEDRADGGGDAFEVGRVLAWEPGARLVFEFRARSFEPGQVTEVEVRFEAEGDGTRVSVEHRGWERLPRDHPARHGMDDGAFADMMRVWWLDLLGACAAHAGR
jgi:uncharacterized protein YndB with AHSA1/START domain